MASIGEARGNEAPEARPAGIPGFALVAGAAALWGSDALFRRGLALELPAAAVVFVEHAILVALTAHLLLRGARAARSFTVRDWVALLVIGVGASATATVLFTQAFTYGNPTTPLLLQKLQPLIAVVGARLLLGERLMPRYALYFLAALAGAYLISFPDPLDVTVEALTPALLAIGAAALWGMGTVLGRHLSIKIDFGSLTALRFAVGLPAAAIILQVQGEFSSLAAIDGSSFLALVLLAIVPGLLAILIYYRGLRQTPASAATLAELAFPLTAVAVNYVVFGTQLAATQWLGMGILMATITIMGLRSARGNRAVGIELRRGAASPQAAAS
ncbi:MAG: DMT family transporter [Actinomycetota bacterium]